MCACRESERTGFDLFPGNFLLTMKGTSGENGTRGQGDESVKDERLLQI